MLSKAFAGMPCANVIHPWSDSCLSAVVSVTRSSPVGCFRLMIPWFLFQYAMKIRKRKKLLKELAKDFAVEVFQFMSFSSSIAGLFIATSCMLRYVIGKYTFLSIVFVPGFLSGLSFVILGPKLRIQILSAFANVALESIAIKLSHSGLLTLNKYSETVFFMVINACLMYAYKLSKSNNMEYTWFYRPNEDSSIDDKKSFSESLYKKTRYYFVIGLGIGILSKLAKDITIIKPKNIHKLFKFRTFTPGIFVASYVAIYEIIVYALNHYFQKKKSIFSLPAGFLAGITYAIEPNLAINLSVFINLIQLLYGLVDNQLLKRIPFSTLMFCLSVASMFHIQFFFPRSVSKIGSKFISLATSDRSKEIENAIKKFIHDFV